jgi:hypothetical protein
MATLAFREAFLHSDTLDPDGDFATYAGRLVRYSVLWATYENTAYRTVNSWATKYKSDYGLYKYTRHIYNPAFRLANFWQTYLMGGIIDPAAGDGKAVPSALPIITDSDALRLAIATLWSDSNWQIQKDIFCLHGTVLGDVALRVVDDTTRGRVYLQLVHPGTLADVTLDERGNVKSYEIQETRANPGGGAQDVTYRETAERDADLVVYKTFMNNAPYAWGNESAEWDEPYGFIPMVVVQHNNVGLPWGWSEAAPALGKIREVDDLASMLHDQIRKTVNAPWLVAGFQKPDGSPKVVGADATDGRPAPGREEVPTLWSKSTDTKIFPMVAPLDIEHVLSAITGVNADLERDFPELKLEILRLSGDTSGAALRVAQEPVENKVIQRRPNYDNALMRAQSMAISIGGMRGYEGYGPFDLASFARGDLAHTIGARPVFSTAPEDKQARDLMQWQTAKAARDAGGVAGMEVYLRATGMEQAEIDLIKASLAAQNGFGNYP